MRQKCVKSAPKVRQKCVKSASRIYGIFLGKKNGKVLSQKEIACIEFEVKPFSAVSSKVQSAMIANSVKFTDNSLK